MWKPHWHRWSQSFTSDYPLLWSNLTRRNNLLAVLNISMFFLTGLVAKGYYYTFISLACIGVVSVGAILPTRLLRRLAYYLFHLGFEIGALYFFVNSIVYWVRSG